MNTGYYGARGVASTATFDSPSTAGGRGVHEDSLPMMPSWDTATSKRVEHHDPEADALEMEKLRPSFKQQEVGLLAGNNVQDERYDYSGRQEAGDLGAGGMHASPYHDYASGGGGYGAQTSPYGGQQTSPYGAGAGGYASQQPYRSVASPVSAVSPSAYGGSQTAMPYGSSADYYSGSQTQAQPSQQGYGQDTRYYAPSVAAPSYHTTQQPEVTSPGGQQYQAFGRKPVGGGASWREV